MRRIIFAGLFTLVILTHPSALAGQDAVRAETPPAQAEADRSAPEQSVMLTTQDWLELERASPAPRIASSPPTENSFHTAMDGSTVVWGLVIGIPVAFVFYMLFKPGP